MGDSLSYLDNLLHLVNSKQLWSEVECMRVRWQKQTRYVYILRSKCGKTPEMLSIKRVLEKEYRSSLECASQ